jgi:ElaB/YqjD/DUF883 family membrane-anchored ribosome-binding protein
MSNDDDSSVAALQKWKEKFKRVRRVCIDSYLSRGELEKLREEYERVRERHRRLQIRGCHLGGKGEEDDEQWIVRENGCVLSSFVCDCAFYNDERRNSCWTNTRKKEKKEKAEEEENDAKTIVESAVAHETWNHRECSKYTHSGSIFGKEVSELAMTGKIGHTAEFLLRAIEEEEEEEEEEEKKEREEKSLKATRKRIRVVDDARKESERAYMFNDQYIVKPPHVRGVEFPWHRDGQYETWKTTSKTSVALPYLSAWVALDDVSEENGALRFKKNEKERFGPDVDVASIRDEEDDTIATMNAGSVVFFMSDVLHASGKNMSEETRRAWMPQFSLGLSKEQEDSSRNSDSLRCLRTALSDFR